MALPPKFSGLAFPNPNISPQAVHTLELYLDYVCPFSRKLFATLHASILPTLPRTHPSVRVLFRPQIQPWHPASLLCIEAATAVQRLAPGRFWAFSAALFERQKDYFDERVLGETRNETYERLAEVAAEVGVGKGEVLELLKVEEGEAENKGNGVTGDVKVMVKANRLVGVHVTPTVLFNGIVEGSISSSFTAQQWEEWLNKNAT